MKKEEKFENARAKYQASIHMSSFEGEVQCNRYSAMLLANTIFIAIIGFSYSHEFKNTILTNSWIKTISPVLGIILCFLWYLMTDRGFTWMNHWIIEARKIEDQIQSETNPVKAGNDLKEKIGGGITKIASFVVIGIIALIYLSLLLGNFLNINS